MPRPGGCWENLQDAGLTRPHLLQRTGLPTGHRGSCSDEQTRQYSEHKRKQQASLECGGGDVRTDESESEVRATDSPKTGGYYFQVVEGNQQAAGHDPGRSADRRARGPGSPWLPRPWRRRGRKERRGGRAHAAGPEKLLPSWEAHARGHRHHSAGNTDFCAKACKLAEVTGGPATPVIIPSHG